MSNPPARAFVLPSGWLVLLLVAIAAPTAWGQASVPTPAGTAPVEVYVPPFDDAQARALAVLDQAQVSVDVAQYNIRNEVFRDALLRLRDRGVQVRIVVDARNAAQPYNTLDDVLEADGLAIHRHANTNSSYAIMHHKFTVVDGQTVMTGSYNWNETAQHVNDENMLVLHDPALAAAYTEEFEELWSDTPDAPGVGAGQLAQVHFSPDDDPRRAVLDLIQGAQRRVRVAMFAFRDDRVASALAAAAGRGVEVTLLTERKQADTTTADETVATGGGRVIVGANTSSPYSAMHQKFCVIDDATVITGACNWTWTAFESSNEDLLVIRDPAVARRYTEAYAALVHRYDPGGYDPADYGVQQAESTVHVVVHCPDTGWGESVWITGDHPALGSGDPAQGVPLTTSEGIFPSWTGRVRLAAGALVRWRAVIRGPRGDFWELGADRELAIDPSGTNQVLDTSFRSLVDVTLSTQLPVGTVAEPRLVGADPALGAWDPQAGWPLQADPSAPDRYLATIPLPGRSRLACKLVLVAADGAVVWEQGADRVVEVWEQDAPQTIDLTAFRD